MSSLKFDLPQLDYTTRFSLWQVKMRAILTQSSDLDEALDGFGKKDAKTWTDDEKRKDRKAFSLIQLHLSNNILQEVLAEKSAAALWLKLESICMSKDLTSKMHVKMKLFSHKLQEGASMMNHLSIFKEIVSDLLSMEVNRDELTLAEVYEALQQREKMKSMVQAEGSSSKAEALQVRGRTENKQHNNYNNYNRDKSKTDRGRSKSKGRDDWFSSYEFVQSGDVVRMGDNNPREIVGIGSVQIKMHDGMTRTLTDETHTWHGQKSDLTHDEGIVRHHTIPYTPQQNGVAERMNRTIISKARCMLSNADVTDAVDFSDNSDDEQQRISVQVEHVEEKENDAAENDNTVVQHSPPVLQQTNSSIAADRPRRNKGPRPRLIEECNLVHHALSCAEQVEHDTEPATYTEAVASVDRVKWISAMQEEMQSLDKNGTWDVVPLPKQKKAVRSMTRCSGGNGGVDGGDDDDDGDDVPLDDDGDGVDFPLREGISPADSCPPESSFLWCSPPREAAVTLLDVKTAFLHGELEEEIYMDQPEGFVVPARLKILGVGAVCQPHNNKIYIFSPKTPSPPPLISPASRSISHPASNPKNPCRRAMAPKRKAPVKAAKAPPKTRTVAPKEKPATMSQEDWETEMEHHAFITTDRRRRRLAALEAAKAVAFAEACLSLADGLNSISSSPSSPGYYAGYTADAPSISQMDGRTRYSPEFSDNDMTVNNNDPFSPESTARGSGAFRFPDLNDSPDLRRTQGHVTDGTNLPRDLFPDDGTRT
ncbi:hypothetical protein QYE76_065691 [Lolium multiflorum]|uniref:Integrase catalytic domain-containing protein n=1 Tax=Lolium multiflorum TaxID=4521 RepID=A0AAD8S8Z5_LOLMU|nr:hypothetical protein QYE76_065691 [Lolium multiflorum]